MKKFLFILELWINRRIEYPLFVIKIGVDGWVCIADAQNHILFDFDFDFSKHVDLKFQVTVDHICKSEA